MSSGYDAKDLRGFLEYALDKGLGKAETLKSRIVSVGRIIDTVGEEEFHDLREVDTDHIMERFQNLEGTKFSPGSLGSYKSRLKSSISDFIRYKEDPASYRPTRTRIRKMKPKSLISESQESGADDRSKENSASLHRETTVQANVQSTDLPLPIRANCIVRISGLPHDLKQTEAQRIANVVLAMAVIEE